jgi:cytoplasmic iron level regulating protein YaaA (DUF328/UPF0246 family)
MDFVIVLLILLSTNTNKEIFTTAMPTAKKVVASRSVRGISMILSPAKTLDLTPLSINLEVGTSQPDCDEFKTKQLVEIIKSKSKKQLKDLLKVSDRIIYDVKKYYDAFDVNATTDKNQKPAVFMFDGPAFKGIDPTTCDTPTFQYMQKNLHILDALYGALRPLDMIHPYRLDMNNKAILKELNVSGHKNMASWWKESITSKIALNMVESKSTILLNLASDEFAAAVDSAYFSNKDSEGQQWRFLKVAFMQEGQVRAAHAKKARGLMVRYICQNQLEDLDEIRQFNWDGYSFCAEKSNDYLMVFDRNKNWDSVIHDKDEGEASAKRRKMK